jgi:hypothetical protein
MNYSKNTTLKFEYCYHEATRQSRRCTRCKNAKVKQGTTRYYCDTVLDFVGRLYTCEMFEEKTTKARDK